MRGSNGKGALAGAAVIALLLAAGYPGVALADSTPPPTETTPTPDPAPPLQKPKPAPKPAPRPVPVYHAPSVQHSTPAPQPQPTYTPPPARRHVVKKAVRHAPKHKRAKPAVIPPKIHAQVKHASVVHIAGVPAATVATDESDALRRSLVITGMGLAALLFFLVVFVPATAARFTPPGRVLMDHQTDLVLVGIAILFLTALAFSLTGNGL